MKIDLPIRFQNFYWALITSFQCITLDGWAKAMEIVFTDFGMPSLFFFMFTTLFARYVIMVNFIAIILNQFDQQTPLKNAMNEMEIDSHKIAHKVHALKGFSRDDGPWR